jgi:hypothetical protein
VRNVRLAVVPAEHGGWAFLFEPVLLGLLVAPSVAGVWAGLAAVAAFLLRQPLKLAMADRRAGKRYARTVLAERLALGFGLVAFAALAIAIVLSNPAIALPILLAAPLALLQAYFDVQRRSRQLAAEIAGAMAIGASASVILLAGGRSLPVALALWAVLGLRAVASILYVRARLRLERGEGANRLPAWAAHLLALAVTCALAYAGLVPWLAVPLMALLTVRAAWGLSRFRRPARAAVIGVQELAASLLTVVVLALGYRLGL